MKTIALILLLIFIPVYKNFGYTLVFESEKDFIKVDTTSFYDAITNWLTAENIAQIKSEILRRSIITKTAEIQMDKMSLQIFNDSIRKSSYSIFFEDDVFKLINSKKAKIYYKDNLIEITSWHKQKSGIKKKGKKELLYIDNTNNEIFIKRHLYHRTFKKHSNRKNCSGPPIFFKVEKERKRKP